MNYQEVLVFEVAGSEFSVPLALVEEVVAASQITPIPNSPPFLLGLAAVRGKVVGVIDAAKRYGLGAALNSYFMICRVRGNLTAIAIDRAVVAGLVPIVPLAADDCDYLTKRARVDQKFVKGAFELFEIPSEGAEPAPTGVKFLEVDADLFVSTEMASRVGEV
jgi:chemotaxis signal transduction protein